MSRLGLGLGITKGGVIPFNPLSLDPYLLFDTQSSMIGTFENPTLDLDPSVPSTLDVITATRAGVATYTDADGLIQSATPNTVRVDQTQGAEVTPTVYQHIGHTDFSTDWTKSNVAVSTSEFNAPDGTSTAYKITNSSSSGNHFIRDSITGGANPSTVVNGRSYTLSVFLRKGTKDVVSIGDGFNVNVLARFNLTSGTVTNFSASNSSIEQVGDWFRCSATITPTGTTLGLMLFTGNNYAGHDTSGDFHAFGPQLEEGTTPTTFVANTTGSAKFITGATFGPRVPMILVEPSATNLVTYSEDFSHSSWTKGGSSVVSGFSSPDGNNTAFKLTEGTNNSFHYIENITYSPTQSKQLFSIYIKDAGDTEFIRIASNDSVTGWDYFFNPKTGQAISDTFTSSNITTLNNGWYRIELLADGSNYVTSGSVPFIISLSNDGSTLSYQGDGTSGVYIWGAQLETGSVATSYIPTSGGDAAARTRTKDNLVISGSDFSDFFNTGGDGTFYAEYQFNDADGANSLIYGSADNQRFAYKNAGSSSPLLSYDGTNVLSYGRLSAGTLLRTALSFDSNSMEGSQDGSAATMSGQTAPFPHNGNFRSATELSIGSDTTGGKQLNGHIKRLIYWPYHSDNL